MPKNHLERVRKICLALPEAHEVEAWGEPTFRVRNKMFAMYANAGNHHGGGHHAVWCKSTRVMQDMLVRAEPERFFVPPYVGVSGWVGARLDPADWDTIGDLLRDAYLLIAPKRIAARLTATPSDEKRPAATRPTAKKSAAKKPAGKKPAARKGPPRRAR